MDGSRPLRVRLRQRVARRPTECWTLIAINLVGAAFCLAAVFAPITMHRFVEKGIILSSIFFALAIGLWFLASQLHRPGFLLAAACDVALLSACVASARTVEGIMVTSLTFVWMAIYAASFFSRRDLYLIFVLIATGSAAAYQSAGLPRWVAIWAILVATTWTAGLILERAVARLRHEADTDALTGLLNRRGFFREAALARSVAERASLPLALVVIDLDDFKSVNDSQGHAGGDRMLVEATHVWRHTIYASDLLARFGGDEFVMLLADASVEQAERVLKRCRVAYPISWTAGVVTVSPGEDLDTCIRRADEQLYQRKMRDRYVDRSGQAAAQPS